MVIKKEYEIDRATYFRTETDEIIFYLLELDGIARTKKLKITETHYSNTKAAEKWQEDILSKIDICHPLAPKAIIELAVLVNGMAGKGKQIETGGRANNGRILK